jgi:hypothetical protein
MARELHKQPVDQKLSLAFLKVGSMTVIEDSSRYTNGFLEKQVSKYQTLPTGYTRQQRRTKMVLTMNSSLNQTWCHIRARLVGLSTLSKVFTETSTNLKSLVPVMTVIFADSLTKELTWLLSGMNWSGKTVTTVEAEC